MYYGIAIIISLISFLFTLYCLRLFDHALTRIRNLEIALIELEKKVWKEPEEGEIQSDN